MPPLSLTLSDLEMSIQVTQLFNGLSQNLFKISTEPHNLSPDKIFVLHPHIVWPCWSKAGPSAFYYFT